MAVHHDSWNELHVPRQYISVYQMLSTNRMELSISLDGKMEIQCIDNSYSVSENAVLERDWKHPLLADRIITSLVFSPSYCLDYRDIGSLPQVRPLVHLALHCQHWLAVALQCFNQEFFPAQPGDPKEWIWDILCAKHVLYPWNRALPWKSAAVLVFSKIPAEERKLSALIWVGGLTEGNWWTLSFPPLISRDIGTLVLCKIEGRELHPKDMGTEQRSYLWPVWRWR